MKGRIRNEPGLSHIFRLVARQFPVEERQRVYEWLGWEPGVDRSRIIVVP